MQTIAGKLIVRGRALRCAFLMFLTAAAFAQEVQISFTEGGEFALVSGGEKAVYEGGRLATGGLSMKAADILQTEAGAFVELRLEPGGTRIKVAENTSLVYTGARDGEKSAADFTLVYGRMRLSSAGSLGAGAGGAVSVTAGGARAVFYQGDAGIDFIARAESRIARGEPALTLYCFGGRCEIVPLQAQGAGGVPSALRAHEGESLSVETARALSYIERRPLDDGIVRYWNHHNFSGGMPLIAAASAAPIQAPPPAAAAPAPVSAEQPPRVIETIRYVPADNARNKKIGRLKNIFLASALGLIAGGVTMQGIGYFSPNSAESHNKLLVNYGYLPLGLGILLGGAALALNPLYADQNAAD